MQFWIEIAISDWLSQVGSGEIWSADSGRSNCLQLLLAIARS